MQRFVWILLVACLPACGQGAVVFQDNFDSGASPLWQNESGGWTASGGVYYAQVPGNFPNAASSVPILLTDGEVELDIDAVSDGGVWLRSGVAPGAIGRNGVLLVTLNGLLYWHVVTDGNYGPSLAAGYFEPASRTHLKVTAAGDTFRAYVNGGATPVTQLVDGTFTAGHFALYSNSGQLFDNVAVTPEPASLLLAMVGTISMARLRRRQQSSVGSRQRLPV